MPFFLDQDESSQRFFLPCLWFCHWGLQPPETVSSIKHFLLWVDLVMMFYPDNRSNKRGGDTYLLIRGLWYWHPAHRQELGTVAHRWLFLDTRQVPGPIYEAAPSHCVLKQPCWKQKKWATVHTHTAMLRRSETQNWLTLVPSDLNYHCVGYQESGWRSLGAPRWTLACPYFL